MLWWFLILGGSTVVVISAAVALFVHVRRQMKTPKKHPETDELDLRPVDPEK